MTLPDSKGLILVSPQSKKESVEEYLKNKQIIGFKPYHVFSSQKPTQIASIESYLPDWLWEKADSLGLVITLHIVKDKVLADTDNQAYIVEKCRKYSNAKLILAHAARGFHAQYTAKGLTGLRGLENIWFDTSGICETPDIAIYAKALGNGYPIGAVIGTKEAMEGANSSFISSTYWTEGIGPAAALAVLKKDE